MKQSPKSLFALLALLLCLSGCTQAVPPAASPATPVETTEIAAVSSGEDAETSSYTPNNLPEYSGSPYVELNGNVPEFSQDQFTTESYEFYTDLDQLGRCGTCYANIGQDLMPTEARESISSVHPSGWVQAQYDCVEGGNLYNRCHLIGFQLTGENANDHNLITGTRYLNVEGMLPFENQVAEYIKTTGHHVLYRVTPVYEGSNLVASGVHMEAASVEDEEIRFNVYCYNVQPGVEINYLTGESCLAGETAKQEDQQTEQQTEPPAEEAASCDYVLNTSSHKFHLPDCSGVSSMKAENRQDYTGDREDLIAQGYTPCGTCKP
jgi:DNA-entry nuclease